jgi:hypothetical protein
MSRQRAKNPTRWGQSWALSAGHSGSGVSGEPPVLGDWQLSSGHYIEAKVAPTLIHPRPDGETSTWERHRMAPSGVEWRIPVVVQGGSWPFQYALTQAPSGMTVGEQYGAPNYGVIAWANPTVGTHTVTVRVRGQEYGRNVSGLSDEQTVTFTLTVSDREDTSKFIWLDSNAAGGGNGSYTTPFNTMTALMSASAAAKQAHIRGGVYDTTRAINGSTDSRVWVGYDGARINRQFGAAPDGHAHSMGDGSFVAGLYLHGGKNYVLRGGANEGRVTVFENTFDGFVYDNAYYSGDTNFGYLSLFAHDNSTPRKYVSVVSNAFGPTTGVTNGGLATCYVTQYAVFEGNTTTTNWSGSAASGFMAKRLAWYFTWRNNRMVTESSKFMFFPFYSVSSTYGLTLPSVFEGDEICWNYGVELTPTGDPDGACVDVGRSLGSVPYDIQVYRNTIISSTFFRGGGTTANKVWLGSNVLLTRAGVVNDQWSSPPTPPPDIANINNIVGDRVNRASFVDSDGLLLESYLNANSIARGTVGHEVV